MPDRRNPDQPSLFDESPELDVAHARRTDPETSHEAADSLDSDHIRASQQAVYQLFRRHGAMYDQLMVRVYERAGTIPYQSVSGLRTRRSELVTKGLLKDSGQRATLPSGRRSIIWQLT